MLRRFNFYSQVLRITPVLLLLFLVLVSCNDSRDDILVDNTELTARSQSTNCLEDVPTTGSCFDGVLSWPIAIPEYPGCTFNVSVEYIQCSSLTGMFNITSLFLGAIEINDHDCPAYDQDVNTAIANGTINDFTIAIDKSIWNVVRPILLNGISPTNFAFIEIINRPSSCIKTCYVLQGGEPFNYIAPVRIPCGTSCCEVKTTYQFIDGHWQQTSQAVEETEECNSDEPIILSCPFGTVGSTDCLNTCDVYAN